MRSVSTILAVVQPPTVLKGFPTARRAKRKTWMSGAGMRQRWKDDDGTIFEWDYQHGHVEVYDKRGKHIGVFDAENGQQVSEAITTRHVEP